MHVINSFFAWPSGAVWGNLVAELLTAAPVWMIAAWRLEKRHQKHIDSINDHYINEISKFTERDNA